MSREARDPSAVAPRPARQRRRGATTLAAGASALGVGLLLGVIGPAADLAGLWIGGLVGILVGAVVLLVGGVRLLSGGRAAGSAPVPLWYGVVGGAALPLVLGLVLEGMAATAS